MNKKQAYIILDILEVASESNWMTIANGMRDKGYEPEEVCSAWKELEQLAEVRGYSPDPADF